MNLDTYIREMGDAEAAKLFGVGVRAVESWRRGARFPRREKAFEIEKATHGLVTFAECYQLSTEKSVAHG